MDGSIPKSMVSPSQIVNGVASVRTTMGLVTSTLSMVSFWLSSKSDSQPSSSTITLYSPAVDTAEKLSVEPEECVFSSTKTFVPFTLYNLYLFPITGDTTRIVAVPVDTSAQKYFVLSEVPENSITAGVTVFVPISTSAEFGDSQFPEETPFRTYVFPFDAVIEFAVVTNVSTPDVVFFSYQLKLENAPFAFAVITAEVLPEQISTLPVVTSADRY